MSTLPTSWESALAAPYCLTDFNVQTNGLAGKWPDGLSLKLDSLYIFTIPQNQFTGYYPDEWFRNLRWLTVFDISVNTFAGLLPLPPISALDPSLLVYAVRFNSFAGTWAHHSSREFQLLHEFKINSNQLAGTWPAEGLCQSSVLKYFTINVNSFAGTWPQTAFRKSASMEVIGVDRNFFDGSWPEAALWKLTGLKGLYVHYNNLAGVWPSQVLSKCPMLTELRLAGNKFTGTWSDNAMRNSGALRMFYINTNRFQGTWPHDGLLRATAMSQYYINSNGFAGSWQHDQISKVRSLQLLSLSENRFGGSWSYQGLPPTLHVLFINANSFTGSWHNDGVSRLTRLTELNIAQNRFVGSCGSSWPPHLMSLNFHSTLLEGSLPSAFAKLRYMDMFRGGKTNIEGSIPDMIAPGQDRIRFLSFTENRLEGVVPPNLARMSAANTTIVLGHGSGGRVPNIAATLLALSIFRNMFEGHLPELHLQPWSYLVAHSNLLACSLPVHDRVRPALAIALLGNRFKRPGLYPPWVSGFETGDFFTVTDRHSWNLLCKIVLGVGTVWLVASAQRERSCAVVQDLSPKSSASSRSPLLKLLHWSARTHVANVCLASPAVLAYLQQQSYSCTVLLERLRVPCMEYGGHAKLAALLELALAARFFSDCRFTRGHGRGSQALELSPLEIGTSQRTASSSRRDGTSQRTGSSGKRDGSSQCTSSSGKRHAIASPQTRLYQQQRSMTLHEKLRTLKQARGSRTTLRWLRTNTGGLRQERLELESQPMPSLNSSDEGLSGAKLWVAWFVLCCCVSAPGASYAMLKAVPGFLQTTSWMAYVLTQSVALCTCVLTVVCLPLIARYLVQPTTVRQELLSVGNLLALPLIPCFITFVFSEDCLSQWATIWPPCTEHPSKLDMLEHVHLPYFRGSFTAVEAHRTSNNVFHEALVRRRALCGGGQATVRRCVNAILERSSLLILGSWVHFAFTGPALQLLLRRHVRLSSAWVQLARVWTLVLIFGAAMPLLCIFAAMNLVILQWMLLQPSSLTRNRHMSMEDMEARMPRFSIDAAVAFSLSFQLFILALCGEVL